MRTIETHKVNPANDTLDIAVLDEPGSGGANHVYRVEGFSANPPEYGGPGQLTGTKIYFQNGPIAEAGVNGLTHEVLLAILADRLEGFQRGPYACSANAEALNYINLAQQLLKNRTLERMNRGVEGTHKV